VNLSPRVDQHPDDGRFPLVRKGYDREAVDHFVRATQAQIAQLLQQYDALLANNHELRNALDDAKARAAHANFSGLGGRVQELLQIAEDQATEITRQAVQEADRLSAQVHAELNELRQGATAELAQMRDSQLAELDALRHNGEHDALELLERAQADAEQLLASARLQAETVKAEAEAAATGQHEAATFESQELLAAAERDSAALRQEISGQRERVLAELKHAQESANQAIQTMLAEASEMQRAAGERLTEETENASKLRTEMLAEAERIKLDATGEAEKIIDRARQRAAAIDSRARQELALRRRQMRDEQDLLNRRKHAMLNQLASLSAIAAQTAEALPDVPEAEFAELTAWPDSADAEMESDPTLGNAAEEAREESEPGGTDEGTEHQASNEEPEPPAAEGEIATANGELRAEDEGETASGDQDQREAPTSRQAYAETEKPSAA
jgi:hypothetical protein